MSRLLIVSSFKRGLIGFSFKLCVLIGVILAIIGVWGIPSVEAASSCQLPDCISGETPIEQLLPEDSLLYRRNYQHVSGAVEIFDAPNGNWLEIRDPGDYYVTVHQWVDGWAEINPGEWVRAEQLSRAPISKLSGIFLPSQTFEYQTGWLREYTPLSAVAGAEPLPNTEALPKYALVNIIAKAVVDGHEWIQVDPDQWVKSELVAVVNPIDRPADVDSQRWVGVDLNAQVAIAYEGKKAVFAALIATGHAGAPTQTGLFHVYARFNQRALYNPAYILEDVPSVLFFNGEQGLHGAYWHDDFGTPRSHGCVNLSLTDANWVYNFLSESIDWGDENALRPVVYVY